MLWTALRAMILEWPKASFIIYTRNNGLTSLEIVKKVEVSFSPFSTASFVPFINSFVDTILIILFLSLLPPSCFVKAQFEIRLDSSRLTLVPLNSCNWMESKSYVWHLKVEGTWQSMGGERERERDREKEGETLDLIFFEETCLKISFISFSVFVLIKLETIHTFGTILW